VPPDGLLLKLTRVYPAPCARIFEFFADAALVAKWWGPRGFSIPGIDFSPRVGAAYRIQMRPPEGDAFQLTGTFHEVDAPSQLSFSFQWEPSDPDDQETVAKLSFEALGDSTEINLEHGPFKTEARRSLHRDGWTESFDKLDELVAEQR
jgi:uncharacterized protein YndB with AHSA1/START domain